MQILTDNRNSSAVRKIQQNFNGSNPDGSLILAVSNSFLSPLEKLPWMQIWENLE